MKSAHIVCALAEWPPHQKMRSQHNTICWPSQTSNFLLSEPASFSASQTTRFPSHSSFARYKNDMQSQAGSDLGSTVLQPRIGAKHRQLLRLHVRCTVARRTLRAFADTATPFPEYQHGIGLFFYFCSEPGSWDEPLLQIWCHCSGFASCNLCISLECHITWVLSQLQLLHALTDCSSDISCVCAIAIIYTVSEATGI